MILRQSEQIFNTQPAPISHLRLMLVMGLTCALGPMAIDMYLPALPMIEQMFETTESLVQQSLMGFFLGLASGQLFMGPFSDKWGRRKIILSGVFMYAIGALGCALAAHVEMLIIFRFVQGFGAAVGMSVGMAVVRDLYMGPQAARLMALIALVVSITPVVAPAWGAAIIQHYPWQMIFVVLSCLAVLAMGLVAFLLPETTSAENRAQFLLSQVLHNYGHLLKSSRFLPFVAVAALCQAGFFAYISGAAFFFIKTHGLDPLHFSFLLMLNALGMMIAAQVNARLLKKFGAVAVVKTAVGIYALCSFLLLTMVVLNVGAVSAYVFVVFVVAVMLPVIMPCCAMLCLRAWGPIAGTASAMMGFLQFGAGAVVTALVGAFANGTAIPMFLTMVLCSVVALGCIVLFWPKKFEMAAPGSPSLQSGGAKRD